MKTISIALLSLVISVAAWASETSQETPIKHRIVEDISTFEEAKRVLIESTNAIKSKQKLDIGELEELHTITYSLEKSIAYFVSNLPSEHQALAKEIAIVVEDIHIQSENHRSSETKNTLEKYEALSKELISAL